MALDSIQLTSDQLYDLVWAKPMRTLAPMYGLSDVGMKKICKKLDVPTPTLGYWAKIQHGQTPPRIPLSPLKKGAPDSHTIFARPDGLSPREKSICGPSLQLPKEIRVPDQLRNPHPLVAQTRDAMKHRDTDQFKRTSPLGTGLDIQVHPSSIPRALRILDTVLKQAEKLGFSASTSYRDGRGTCFIVEGEKVPFWLAEKTRRVDKPKEKRRYANDSQWEYVPSGLLRLEIREGGDYHGRKTWSDSAKQTLEDLIAGFLSGVRAAALGIKESNRRWEEFRERQREEEEHRRELERERAMEAQRVRDLEQQAARWVQSQQLSAYLDEVERRAAAVDLSEDQRERHQNWMSWARTHVRNLDPLATGLPYDRPLTSVGGAVGTRTRIL